MGANALSGACNGTFVRVAQILVRGSSAAAAADYTVDGASVWIDKPVQVQVLVERRVNSAAGAASADPNAEAFARDVTALLQSPHTRPDYQALRNFYRIVECFRLIKHQNIDAETLRYLLYEHRHESVEVRRYVVGVRRSEEIVCGGEIRERNGMIEAAEEGRLLEYRGGVEVRVETPDTHFERVKNGPLSAFMRHAIRTAADSSASDVADQRVAHLPP